jgi:hypothetical protein
MIREQRSQRVLIASNEPSTVSLKHAEDRLIWIFGSSRSGSTWLLRMLSEVPGVVPIDDPHLGHHLGVWRPIPLAWAVSSDPPPPLTTLLELKRDREGYFFAERYRDAWWEPLRQLITARFEAQAEAHLTPEAKTATYIVKEPGSHVARLLLELFPRSKLVFLLRDGRDASRRSRSGTPSSRSPRRSAVTGARSVPPAQAHGARTSPPPSSWRCTPSWATRSARWTTWRTSAMQFSFADGALGAPLGRPLLPLARACR